MGRVIATMETEITAPTVAPLDLSYVRTHLKSISSSEDALIESWILAASQFFRGETGRELTTSTREYWLDGFPATSCRIELPRPPLQSVTSVQYLSGGSYIDLNDGGSPAVALYQVMAPAGPYARPGYIIPTSGAVWPTVTCSPGAVKILYVCGYGDTANEIPDLVKTTLCALVGSFEQFRSETHASERGVSLERLPFGIDLLMQEFKSSALRTTVPREALWA